MCALNIGNVLLWSKLSSIARMNASLHYLHGQGPLSLVFQISQHRASKRLLTSNLLSPDEIIIIIIIKIIRHRICLSLFPVTQNLQPFPVPQSPTPNPTLPASDPNLPFAPRPALWKCELYQKTEAKNKNNGGGGESRSVF